MASQRVAAIGVDAAEWAHVDALIDEGLLPNVADVVRSGAFVELRGDTPYRAEATWTEFLTGRTPDESRYWSTAEFDTATYDMWELGAYQGTPFYARPDLTSIVLDAPHSVIAPEGRGCQVTAWGAHSPQFPPASQPADLIAEIDRRFGVHRAPRSDSHVGWHNAAYGLNLTEALLEGIDTKVDICEWLMATQPDWDFFLTVLSETHTAGHQFLHGFLGDHPLAATPSASDAARHYRAVYAATDDAVGRLASMVGDDTVVVLFAVHGMTWNGSDVTGGVLLPELLHRRHFGESLIDFPRWSPSDPPIVLEPSMTPIEYLLRLLRRPRGTMYGSRSAALSARLAWEVRKRAPGGGLEALQATWRRARGRPDRARWWEMDVRPPATALSGVAGTTRQPLDYHVASWYCDHWPAMEAFVIPSFSDAHIRVNLRGRERSGVVAPERYAAVLDDLEETLRHITDARSGLPVVQDVFRVREKDPTASSGPTADMVVTFGRVSDAIDHPDTGVVGASPIMRSGEHTANGWAAIRGPSATRTHLTARRPQDLAATLTALLGKPSSPLVTGSSFAEELDRGA